MAKKSIFEWLWSNGGDLWHRILLSVWFGETLKHYNKHKYEGKRRSWRFGQLVVLFLKEQAKSAGHERKWFRNHLCHIIPPYHPCLVAVIQSLLCLPDMKGLLIPARPQFGHPPKSRVVETNEGRLLGQSRETLSQWNHPKIDHKSSYIINNTIVRVS
jgi:hypothetical protein